MKKHLSVFTLIAHHSIYKVMLLLLVMVGAEIGIFFRFVHRNPGTGFSLALELNHTFWIFSAALLLVTLILTRTGKTFVTGGNYTVQRLSISEKTFFYWMALYHSICFLLVWAVQLAVIFFLGQYYYSQIDGTLLNSQKLLLAFYSDNFLHSLLPLEDIIVWYANAAAVAALGCTTAYFPFLIREHRFPGAASFILSMTILFFCRENGVFMLNAGMIFFSILAILSTLYNLYFGRKEV